MKEVTLKIRFEKNRVFPEYAGRKECDNWCPMFLWDGESHDYCLALQSRTDIEPLKCPFHDKNEHIIHS